MTSSKLLVPIDLPDPEPVSPALLASFANVEVVLVGIYVTPEQTPPRSAETQLGDNAQDALDAVVADMTVRGISVESTLVFTHDREETISQAARNYRCHGVVLPGETDTANMERVLVGLRDARNVESIAAILSDIIETRNVSVELLHVTTKEDDVADRRLMLHGAREVFGEHGLDTSRIDVSVIVAESVPATIGDHAAEADVLVLGETEPTIRDRILGETQTNIVAHTERPIILVRRLGDDSDNAAATEP